MAISFYARGGEGVQKGHARWGLACMLDAHSSERHLRRTGIMQDSGYGDC